jgi:hypothetical protein
VQQAKELGILVATTSLSSLSSSGPKNAQSKHEKEQEQEPFTTTTTTTTCSCFQPLPRLWQPDPMIQNVLLPLLMEQPWLLKASSFVSCCVNHHHQQQQQQDDGNVMMMKKKKSRCWGEIWDLGAGSGRDACFLAEELKAVVSANTNSSSTHRGTTMMRDNDIEKTNARCASSSFRVIAMDQRYRRMIDKSSGDGGRNLEEAEEQSSPMLFWKRRGVAHETECRQVDLENEAEMHQLLLSTTTSSRSSLNEENQSKDTSSTSSNSTASSCVQCIYAVRYWNRPLVERIANDDGCTVLATSGAIFAMSTFGKPHVGAAWNFAHPKVKKVVSSAHF